MTSVLDWLDGWCARAERRPGRWLVLLAALLALQVAPLWYATPDGASYLSMARSLAAGGPIGNLGRDALAFPLGYPLLISPVFLLGPRPLLALSLAHWLLAVVAMLGVFRWARRLSADAAPWVTTLVAANVHVWILYRRTLSESAFCAVLPWTVTAWNRVVESLDEHAAVERGARLAARAAWAAGLLVLLTAIREAGALVGAGVVLAAINTVRRGSVRWRNAGVALAGSLAAAACALVVVRPERIAAAGPAFAGRLAGYGDAALAATAFGERLHLRVLELGQLLIPGMFKAYDRGWAGVTTVLYVPLVALVGIAWWRLARRAADVFVWTVPPYLALYLAWPYAAGTRYLLPLLPVLWLAWWQLCERLPHRRLIIAALVVAHLGVAIGYWVAIDAPRARACDRHWPAVDLVAARTRQAYQPLSVADGVPECVRLMLELAIDAPVGPRGGGDAPWLLLPAAAAIPEHFVVDTVAGDYVLARRHEIEMP